MTAVLQSREFTLSLHLHLTGAVKGITLCSRGGLCLHVHTSVFDYETIHGHAASKKVLIYYLSCRVYSSRQFIQRLFIFYSVRLAVSNVCLFFPHASHVFLKFKACVCFMHAYSFKCFMATQHYSSVYCNAFVKEPTVREYY